MRPSIKLSRQETKNVRAVLMYLIGVHGNQQTVANKLGLGLSTIHKVCSKSIVALEGMTLDVIAASVSVSREKMLAGVELPCPMCHRLKEAS